MGNTQPFFGPKFFLFSHWNTDTRKKISDGVQQAFHCSGTFARNFWSALLKKR